MKQILTLGYSPCPNDTFIFFALSRGLTGCSPFEFRVELSDVENLNQQAGRGMLDITKVSSHAILHLLDGYALLRSGGAIGRGCGPLVVAKQPLTPKDLSDATVAVPGTMTTANLLLRLNGAHRGRTVVMPFDLIMPAVAAGTVDAGVIIHEGRFTYPSLGLRLVLDLGAWWETETGLPLPLGGIMIRRELGRDLAGSVDSLIRASLQYARNHPAEAWPYVREHAQEMEPDVIRQHIDMFVNEFSFDAGAEGEAAIRFMLNAAAKVEDLAIPKKPLFWDQST